MKIEILYHTDIEPIQPLPNGDWIDLRASKDYTLYPGDFALIDLGVSMKLPDGYEAHLAPRSSTFKKWGIIQVNSVGVIDNSFAGNNDIWCMPVYATRITTFFSKPLDIFFQACYNIYVNKRANHHENSVYSKSFLTNKARKTYERLFTYRS